MASVDIKNLDGKTVGTLELPDEVFAAEINPHLLHETSRWYLAMQRAGTHKTKGRGEVSGAGRKLWRQKGTGRARVGSIRSPIWRKGGTVHGPVPRSYAYRLPRKMLLGALRSALSAKLADERMTVVEEWTLETHKTNAFREALTKLDGESRTMLLVDVGGGNRNLELASRNLEGVKLVDTVRLAPYDLLRHERLVISRDAAIKLANVLAPADAAEAVAKEATGEAEPKKTKKRSAARKEAARPRKSGRKS